MSIPALASIGLTAADGVLSAGTPAKAAAKVDAVAKDFESLFLGQLLKQMRQTGGKEGGMFGSDSADVYGGLFDFFMGKHLSDAGGLGIAASIKDQIKATTPDEPTRPDTRPAVPPRT